MALLLGGLLGMHGLGAGDAVAGGGHHSGSSAAHAGMVGGGEEHLCHGGSGGGHVEHADGMCASGAVGAGPALALPVLDPVGTVSAARSGLRFLVVPTEGGRAPPTLAELQLLRI